ncbi:MAG: hypothetical protein K6G01_05775 [Eubacterium sp.]|nr:hypothetical protein [Eubacterium sp.]
MLGKLIKYDLRAAGRMLIFLYIAVIGMAIVFGISMRRVMGTDSYYSIMGIYYSTSGKMEHFYSIVSVIYVILLIVMLLLTFVMIVRQFYKNMLGGQGYLMNSLPVKTWMHLASKTITGFIWAAVSSVISVLSILIAVLIADKYMGIWSAIKEVLTNIPADFAILYIFTMIAGAVSSVLMIYLALMLGNLFNKHKLGMAVLMFIVLLIATSVIRSVILVQTYMTSMINDSFYLDSLDGFRYSMVPQLIISIIYAVGFWIVTNWLMKNKLNLE